MKHRKNFLLFLFLFISSTVSADIAVTPTYTPRSQGADKMRTLVGTLGWGHIDLPYVEWWYGCFSGGVVYTRSFNEEKIAQCMFGSDVLCETDCTNKILVQGSDVAVRDPRAWLADYLYLGCDYNGSFEVNPRIQNVMGDLNFYLGMDAVARGLYVRAYGPITWTKWEFNFCVTDPVLSETAACRPGYMTPGGTEKLLGSLADYFVGMVPTSTENITFAPLKFAKMPNCCDEETKFGFADLYVELGWNAVQDENSHFGLNLQMGVPTGGKRRAEYVFMPVVGNGNHWEFGGGLSAHYNFLRNENADRHAGIYTDFNVRHVFGANEERTFDLCGKPNSRYMLATRMDEDVNNLTGSDFPNTSEATYMDVIPPDGQFAREYVPVANLTTASITVKNAAVVDWVILFNFSSGFFSLDVGYNLWVRTCDQITSSRGCDVCLINGGPSLFDEAQDDVWALKGDAQMFGYATATEGGLTINQPVELSATEIGADIHRGTNSLVSGSNAARRNLGIDNARYAYAGATNQRLNYAIDLVNAESSHIQTSIQPALINFENIEFQPTQGLSHKVFANLGFTLDRKRFVPFFGFGAFAEFGSNTQKEIPQGPIACGGATLINSCSGECFNCSLSQWAVWFKFGASFG